MKHKHCVNEYSVIVYVFGRIGRGYIHFQIILYESASVWSTFLIALCIYTAAAMSENYDGVRSGRKTYETIIII